VDRNIISSLLLIKLDIILIIMSELKIYGSIRVKDGSMNLKTLKELCLGPAVATAYASGRLTVNVSTAWSRVSLPLNGIITNRSSVFELASDGIKVKKTMKALISFQATRWGTPNTDIGECDMGIENITNNSTVTNCFCDAHRNELTHYNGSPILASLTANDILRMYIGSGGTGNFQFIGDGNATYLTIQEVFE
jgi:hypothetical protein